MLDNNLPFDWIFFDCFNTLIDDFDETGSDSGLSPMHHIPVDAGFYNTVEEFRRDYHQWRQNQWIDHWQEVLLPDRLLTILKARSPNTPTCQIESVVTEMMSHFEVGYPLTLRLPQGVNDMLNHWQGKVHMGVVSNFHLSQRPAQLLDTFGLKHYFRFVLDSATCGWKKPGREIYQAAIQLAIMAEPNAHRILFVGDHLKNDVLMPIQLGMKAIYFDRTGDRPASEKAPDYIVTITHWDQFRDDFVYDRHDLEY